MASRGNNRKKRYSSAQIIEAVRVSVGRVYETADKLGCCHTVIYARAKAEKEIRRAIKEARESVNDLSECELLKIIKKRKIDSTKLEAIKFQLSTRGKRRGYVTKHLEELTGKGGQPLLSLESIVAAVVKAEKENESETAQIGFPAGTGTAPEDGGSSPLPE